MKAIETFEKPKVKTYRDFNVYQQSFELAMEMFHLTSGFPADERYALTDQLRRAARSIPANLAEGWAKRKYASVFRRHLSDCIGSCEEVKVWIEFAWKCRYLQDDEYEHLRGKYSEVGAMLSSLLEKWESF